MWYFCPNCWSDFVENLTHCPCCGQNIEEFWQTKDFVEKLIVALDHPEPETPIRAAWILGKLREERAIDPLISLIERTQDVYIACEAIKALSQLDNRRTRQFLKNIENTHPAAMVRNSATAAVSGISKRFNREEKDMIPVSIDVEMPGGVIRSFTDLVLDYTGTLSLDGMLLPGVVERLEIIAANLRITVLTTDTFGTAAEQLKGLPVEIRVIRYSIEKAEVILRMGCEKVIAIGNGRNDVTMMELAGIAIAVIGQEGAAGELLRVADVVVRNVHDALDLVTNPLRLKATLRD
jgi:soluble P-type ATPase